MTLSAWRYIQSAASLGEEVNVGTPDGGNPLGQDVAAYPSHASSMGRTRP
jgi:hypothetical protein